MDNPRKIEEDRRKTAMLRKLIAKPKQRSNEKPKHVTIMDDSFEWVAGVDLAFSFKRHIAFIGPSIAGSILRSVCVRG